jgi:hypothetical protein
MLGSPLSLPGALLLLFLQGLLHLSVGRSPWAAVDKLPKHPTSFSCRGTKELQALQELPKGLQELE